MKLSALLTAATSAFIASVLPACDGAALREIKPGLSSMAEVRSRLGEPGSIHHDADGVVVWEYHRQPNGIECHMIAFGPDQIVLRIENALAEANLARVREGMSRDEIRRLLGKPASITPFSRQQEEVWEWRVAGTLPSDETYFNVHFAMHSGLVAKTSRRQAQSG